MKPQPAWTKLISVPTQTNTRSNKIATQPHPTLKHTNLPTVQLPMVQPTHRPQQQNHGTATPRQPGSSILNPDTMRQPVANNPHQPTMKREKRHPTRATSVQKGNSSKQREVPQDTHNNSDAHKESLSSQRNAERLKRFSLQGTSCRTPSDIPRGSRQTN